MMNSRAGFAMRGGETEELLAAREAIRFGTPAQRTEAREWFDARERRMAAMQAETRTAPRLPALRPMTRRSSAFWPTTSPRSSA